MEKRRARRVGRRFIVRYGEREFENTAFTNDVSVSGMFIISTYLPNIGTRLHIEVEAGKNRYVHFEAVVTRQKRVPAALQRSGKGGFGVRLLTPTEVVAEIVGRPEAAAPIATPAPFAAPSTPPPPQAPQAPQAPEAPPNGGFRLRFASIDQLRRIYDEQIRRGGIVVPAEVARASPVERGAEVTLELELAYLAAPPKISLRGRVLHVFPGADGKGGALAVGFDDAAGASSALAPYVR